MYSSTPPHLFKGFNTTSNSFSSSLLVLQDSLNQHLCFSQCSGQIGTGNYHIYVTKFKGKKNNVKSLIPKEVLIKYS